ncbi:MAG TPA: phytanoyl-CoA dioxygenase family protein [Candidatus Angelobacter sp.]|nr:phytanoyl-CoA dioxygenase family protein [Candidatus Angelobacter sp.]
MIARDQVIENLQNAAWLQQVGQDGYAILPNIVNGEELQQFISALEHSISRRTRAGVRHLLRTPEVSGLANAPRLSTLAKQVLGDDAFPFRATLFDKSPDSNWLITWHQDTALPLTEKKEIAGWGPWSVKEGVTYAHAPASALEQVLAIRLHLDNSTEENGPLRVIPGSHHDGVLTDREIEAFVSNAHPATCLVEKDGVILMRPLIIHASSKSRSETPRRVLHIEYATLNTVPLPLQLAIT